jgi:hypothetical protein
MSIKKHTKKHKHKRFSKKSKKYTKRQRIFKKGGAENTNCPDATVSCNILDKQFKGKLNPTWNTCINMNGIYNHIIYITSTNVLIKSIETLQIPEFYVKLPDEIINIEIEDSQDLFSGKTCNRNGMDDYIIRDFSPVAILESIKTIGVK